MPSKKWDLEHRDFHRNYQREYQKAYKQVPEQKLKAQIQKRKYYLWKVESAIFRNILLDNST